MRNLMRILNLEIVALVAMWIFMAVFVDPRGEFPINDDWAYAWSARHFAETGEIRFHEWLFTSFQLLSSPLLTQILWGSTFLIAAGEFSFTALRLSTMVMGLVGVLGTYYLLKELRRDGIFAFTGAFVISVNPIYFELSNSFMTDVPFYALFVVSLLFFARTLRRFDVFDYALATVLCCAAILIRQVGLALPLSFYSNLLLPA